MPEIDLFGPAKSEPNEWQGTVHALVVRELGEPEGSGPPLRPLVDYEIQHPWSCKQEEREPYGGGVKLIVWACDVGYAENDGDLAFNLHYSGTEVTEPGFYLVQGWGRKSYAYDYGAWEYDNGVAVVAGPAPLPSPVIGVAAEHSIEDPFTGEATVRVRLA